MDFELTDEQVALQAIAREVAEREIPSSLVRSVVEDGADTDALWKTLVALEWPGLTVPLDRGGSGASVVELAVLLEELGWAADPSPLLATTSQFLPLVRALPAPVCDAQLARIAEGHAGAAIFDGITARADGESWLLDGVAQHVLDADRVDMLAVATADAVFLVATDTVSVTRERSTDDSLHLCTVRFQGVRVAAEHASADVAPAIERARNESLIGIASMIIGASQHAFDLVLDHIKQRHQFGVPIGSFQAVKHMAVDLYTALQRARAAVHFAALAITAHSSESSQAAAMAKAAASDAQRLATQHGIQLFGGLGFTWENDLQLYLRRAKTADVLFGNGHHHRVALSRMVLERIASGEAPAQNRFDDETEAFRAEFDAWLDAHVPSDEEALRERSESSAHIPDWARSFQRAMFDDGWFMPGNPPEFGGRNATLLQQFVHQEELGRRRIYQSFNPQGVSIIVPSILAFGTDDQKQKWAVPLLRAEITAALGMSEPDAGSDLAGLRTRAVLDGDEFVVNGQKVWTSGAHDADVILAFVRTDPDVPKHKGISCLLIPTDTPGVTRRPFGSIQGKDELDFNEVFFDDARVPVENLIGELNQGWRVATGSLGHERAMLWLGYSERLDDLVERGGRELLDHRLADDSYALDWFGHLVIDGHALRVLGHRTLAKAAKGVEPAEQSILKLLGSEAVQRATLHVLEAIGPDALDPDVRSAPIEPLNLDVWTNPWFDMYLRTFSMTIVGGTSQIQRNIVAEHVLGLPR